MESLIGNTPMVRLHRLAADLPAQVWVKLEGNNPAGSVKDRPAMSMIRCAEERGDIKPGERLMEATSGNTGIALAMAAAVRGYPLRLVMPENMSLERRAVMRAFGAELVLTPADSGMEGAIDKVRHMQKAGEGYVLDQFSNPDNPRAHYEGTGPEIWRDSGGGITHFVSSMGTTGTIMGCARFLREKKPDIEIVGVHPAEGARIPGIRCWPEAYRPKIYNPEAIDRFIYVEEEEANDMTRRLARVEGIFAGPSSGGCIWSALRVAAEAPEGSFIVAIVCDRGDRYVSTGLFNAVK